jgi:hypothetical protein
MELLMKKRTTISLAALAISASSSTFALIGSPNDTKTYCLEMYTDASGSSYAGSCDQTANNARRGTQIGENGCAQSQVALTTGRWSSEEPYPIQIHACMPPNATQL